MSVVVHHPGVPLSADALLEALRRLSYAVATASDLAAIYDAALTGLLSATVATRAAVLIADGGGVFRFAAWRGLSKEYRAAVEGHTPWPAGTRGAAPVVVPDALADPSLSRFASVLTTEGVRALAFLPLCTAGAVSGTFMLYSDAPHAFDERDLRVGETIAAQIGFALTRNRAEAEAREANRLKDEFLAALSHELRTPVNAIVGWARILEQRPTDRETAERAVAAIKRNAAAQEALVRDLLDVSRITSGQLALERRPTPLEPIVSAALDAARPAAEAKGVMLEASDGVATHVLGDPTRLQQIVWNLVSNGVKFTPSGGCVQVRIATDASNAVIAVRDTGQGISPEFLPHVFERFRQADPSSTRLHSGLGLGLAIVRHLVELHGGTVSADSTGEGHGSTFTVRLPRLPH